MIKQLFLAGILCLSWLVNATEKKADNSKKFPMLQVSEVSYANMLHNLWHAGKSHFVKNMPPEMWQAIVQQGFSYAAQEDAKETDFEDMRGNKIGFQVVYTIPRRCQHWLHNLKHSNRLTVTYTQDNVRQEKRYYGYGRTSNVTMRIVADNNGYYLTRGFGLDEF